jgi:fatty acid-binding protein DegV
VSGTLNSARLAAKDAGVPVRLVDTGTASFAISLCLWESAEAVGKGASLDEAAIVAESVAARTGNVFVVGALRLARAGGRLAGSVEDGAAVPVLSLVDGKIVKVGEAVSAEEAADVMAAAVVSFGSGLRVGLTVADAGAAPLWQALEARLVDAAEVIDLVRYRVAPSVAAHTGPGTAGAMYYSTG